MADVMDGFLSVHALLPLMTPFLIKAASSSGPLGFETYFHKHISVIATLT